MRPWLALVLAVTACGYQPSAQTNVAAPSYRTDLATCEDKAHADVTAQNARRALNWLSSPVRRWGQIRDQTQSCMVAKGYGGLRWCTADELRSGTRAGGVVVTAEGVQCTDPPAAERRKPAT